MTTFTKENMRNLLNRGFATIGLYDPKTNENVGSVMRAAMCYQASLVLVHGQRYKRARTDTTEGYRHIPLQQTDNLLASAPYGSTPVAVEFVESSIELPNFTHPDSAFYIFGPEDGDIPKQIADACKHRVYVPTSFCMNLAACVNVVLYDRLAKRTSIKKLNNSSRTV